MNAVLRTLGRGLQALLITAAISSAVHADPCSSEKSADRAMAEAQRVAERAQRIAEQIALQAQHAAEMATARAQWAAEHASEQASIDAERAQAQAEQAASRARRDAERAARAAERAAERAAIGARGVVVTNDAVLFLDGPEVPRDEVEWADDARSRRMRQPMTTDTTFRVGPGVTLSLANLSGDIAIRVWDRSEVRVNAEHDRSDRLVAVLKDGQLKLGVRSLEGGPADVEWNLTVPTWLPLEISGIESDIEVTGLRSSVRAQSMRGDVSVSSCQGPMELNSVEGEVHAEDVNGDVTAGSVNSLVRLVRVLGPIEAQSINGDIQMSNVSSGSVSASTLNGRVYWASKYQPHGRYAFSSHNGKIFVGMDQAQVMNVTVSSFGGQLESSIPLPPAPPQAPVPPSPPTPPSQAGWKTWKTWKMSLPAEATPASTASSAPAAGPSRSPSPRSSRPAPMVYTPRAPELELESFGGQIQLASRAEIEHVLQLRQAMRDSAQAMRALSRLRSTRVHIHEREAPEPPKPAEDPEKN